MLNRWMDGRWLRQKTSLEVIEINILNFYYCLKMMTSERERKRRKKERKGDENKISSEERVITQKLMEKE